MLRRALRPAAALAAATLVLVACGGDDDEGADGEATTTTVEQTTTTVDATTTSTTTAEVTTTTAPGDDDSAAIALRGDGLGVVSLGSEPDAAVSAVTAALGDPSLDTGWESSFGTYGTCPGTEVRAVEWGGLVLLFTDGPTDFGSTPHLFAWRLGSTPPPLATGAGFGLGAQVSDAQELYPGAVEVVPPEEPFPGMVLISADGGQIRGFLEGEVVTNLEAGAPCGE